jgi:hypothetical protein
VDDVVVISGVAPLELVHNFSEPVEEKQCFCIFSNKK